VGGYETGYDLYMSIDGGASYVKIEDIPLYNPFETLVVAYPSDTYAVDDTVGFQIDFVGYGGKDIDTVTRAYLFSGANLALLGEEVISLYRSSRSNSDWQEYQRLLQATIS
jgi:hypothetical protein